MRLAIGQAEKPIDMDTPQASKHMETNLEHRRMAAATQPDEARRRSLTARVWFALLALTLSLYLYRQIYDGPYGSDFTIFLTAARILMDGHGAHLYDIATQIAAQNAVTGGLHFEGGLLPFNYPPYVAFLFVPLLLVSPAMAFYVWVALQWGVLLVLARSVRAYFAEWTKPVGGSRVFTQLIFCFVPIIEALLMGQMSLLLLALWWWIFVSWRGGRWTQLGVALALAMFKPQMAVLLVVALVAQRQWRALASALGTGALLWGTAMLVGGPGILGGYLSMLQTSASTIGTLGFYPDAMPNLRGLITIAGLPPQLSLQTAMLLWVASIGATAWLWRARYSLAHYSLAARFGLTVLAAVLLSPHLYIHDASLLLLAVWCAQVAYAEQGSPLDTRWLLLPFGAMFLGIYALVFAGASYTGLIVAVWLFGIVLLKRLLGAVRSEKSLATRNMAQDASQSILANTL